MSVSSSTRVAAVIGDPVAHSLSPVIHNAAFAAAGLDWVYVACRVPESQTEQAIRGAAALGFGGLSVTMPGKAAALAACDQVSDLAQRVGAVNCISFRDGAIAGDNTDGAGACFALEREGVVIDGASVLLLGAGGAARAISAALRDAGAAVTVAARRPASAAIEADAVVPFADAAAVAAASTVVINATPVGMDGAHAPLDPTAVPTATLVLDTIYQPLETPLVAAHRAQGGRAVNGVAMLVGQAAAAFERWTDVPAPRVVMESSVADVLGR
ncbi:MAG: shikimate dehydrogenase [Acidimicrobiia bacterium]